MIARRPRSLRGRLTLWYTSALAGLLAVLAVASAVLLDRGLRSGVDASLASLAATVAESSLAAPPAGSLESMLDDLFGPVLADRVWRLLDPLGRPDPRQRRRQGEGALLPLSPEAMRAAARGEETFETLRLPPPAGEVRLLTRPVVERGRLVNVVQVAMSLATVTEARRRFLVVLGVLSPLAVGLAATGGWFLAGRALAPVDAMVDAARRIEAEDLSRRLMVPRDDDELGRLATVLNDMLSRLERSFGAAQRFSADAAHELRTPLTVLKGELEVALRSAPDAGEPRRVLESCLEEADRLAALVDDLLFMARADAGADEPPRDPVDLAAVIHDATPALRALAERAGVGLALEVPPACPVRGSEPMLFRAVLNVGDNAIRYAGPGGAVRVVLQAEAGEAVLVVDDSGPGIAPADLPRIFDRFWRGDPARRRGGTGLGLALTRSIVELHGGRIAAGAAPGGGARITLRVPLARA